MSSTRNVYKQRLSDDSLEDRLGPPHKRSNHTLSNLPPPALCPASFSAVAVPASRGAACLLLYLDTYLGTLVGTWASGCIYRFMTINAWQHNHCILQDMADQVRLGANRDDW